MARNQLKAREERWEGAQAALVAVNVDVYDKFEHDDSSLPWDCAAKAGCVVVLLRLALSIERRFMSSPRAYNRTGCFLLIEHAYYGTRKRLWPVSAIDSTLHN